MKCFSFSYRPTYDVNDEVFLVHLTGCHSYDVDEEMLFVLFRFLSVALRVQNLKPSEEITLHA